MCVLCSIKRGAFSLGQYKGLFGAKECKTEERKKNAGIGCRCCGKTEEWENTGKTQIGVFGS